MVASIPASDIVNVLPGVISAGGNGLDMVGLILTNSARIPTGVVLSFPSASAVADYFGPSSDEATKAVTYFAGYDGSVNRPAFVLFAAFATAARAAFMRGAPSALTLAQLQALTGTLIVTANGTQYTSATINLAAATSFSNAAALIQAGFTSPPFTVTYDNVSGGFLFTTNTTGDTAAISFATGTLATALGLTAATGAVQSAGSDVDIALTAMNDLIAQSQDFVSFTTLFAASDDQIVDFATWNDGQDNRFLYVPWTSTGAATTNSDTTSPAKRIAAANLSGTAPIWSPSADKAVFVLGYIASIDFNRTNGRTTAAFRSGSGLTADVTNQSIARNLEANGYSFYGTYGTANDAFTWLYNGQVSGDFAWIDSYVNQVWLNNRFQLTLMTALGALGQIPYNDDGYEMIAASLTTDISDAVDFGAIRAGVTLTELQKQQIAALAGQDISDEMFARGWYLSVKDPGAEVRAERGSPICTFFYTDGQSVQRIVLSSLMVQ